jgi:hypothetical protein
MTAIVKVSKSAFFELLMAAFEAYAVKHDKQDIVAIETHAQLWGTINKQHPFKCHIKHVSVDTSAIRKRDSVSSLDKSLEIKKDIANAFGDGYSYIGTYHTHPYLKKLEVTNTSSLRKNKLYNFSFEDHLCEVDSPAITIGDKLYSVALVMTVFAADKADDRKDGFIDSNLTEFSLGNIKFWLKAQVYQHKSAEMLTVDDKEALYIYKRKDHHKFSNKSNRLPIPIDTDLECELDFYLEKFGRLNINSTEAEYKNSKIAEKRWFAY